MHARTPGRRLLALFNRMQQTALQPVTATDTIDANGLFHAAFRLGEQVASQEHK